jgi:molybdate transport system ATP-binding protein
MRIKARVPLGGFVLDVDIALSSQIAAIFGPSGAGKTSLLEAIAGLREIESGDIEIGERTLFSSARSIDLPPRERAIGYVPQEPALFPHLSVRENLLFGARSSATRDGAVKLGFDQVVALLQIGQLLDRRIDGISGGEAQRVALGRALLSRPRLLLLDEPLASLDIGLKERILPYLKRVRDELRIPMIYVTHDPVEVLSLADCVVMLREGRVVAQGVPQEVFTSRTVLAQLGRDQLENVFEVTLINSSREDGRSLVRLEPGIQLFIPYTPGPPESTLQIGIRADDVLIAVHEPQGLSAGNIIKGVIGRIEWIEGQVVLRIAAGVDFYVRLTPPAARRLGLSVGLSVFLIIKTRSCIIL